MSKYPVFEKKLLQIPQFYNVKKDYVLPIPVYLVNNNEWNIIIPVIKIDYFLETYKFGIMVNYLDEISFHKMLIQNNILTAMHISFLRFFPSSLLCEKKYALSMIKSCIASFTVCDICKKNHSDQG